MVDLPDLTVEKDERGSLGPRIAFLDRMDEDQEHPASVVSTSRVAIGGTDRRDKSTCGYPQSFLRFGSMFMWSLFLSSSAEDAGSTRGGEIDPEEASRGVCRYDCDVGSLSSCASREESP